MNDIKTYEEMNNKICGLLRLNGDNVSLYAAQRIKELETENASLHARLDKAVILPCVDKGDWYYTVKFPARVEDEIFIINKEKNSILSAAVNNIVSYDESGKEWIFSIRYDCEGCDKYGECDYFDCPSKNCIWGDMDIPHGDNEYAVGYTGVNLSDYNKTWFTDRDKAIKELQRGNNGR